MTETTDHKPLDQVDPDDLAEEYAQSELDQDRNPTNAGFQAWKARRAEQSAYGLDLADAVRAASDAGQPAGHTAGEDGWDDDESECEGHESLAGEDMGETVFCDGTCRTRR